MARARSQLSQIEDESPETVKKKRLITNLFGTGKKKRLTGTDNNVAEDLTKAGIIVERGSKTLTQKPGEIGASLHSINSEPAEFDEQEDEPQDTFGLK